MGHEHGQGIIREIRSVCHSFAYSCPAYSSAYSCSAYSSAYSCPAYSFAYSCPNAERVDLPADTSHVHICWHLQTPFRLQ